MVENLNRDELNNAIKKTRESFDTDNPTVPFIEGDGIGVDIWPASQSVSYTHLTLPTIYSV